MKKPHSLIFWINMLSVIFLACSTAVLAVFAKISMDSLLEQEIENRRGFLRMEADNVDGNLDALERYLYQAFNDSEELVCIETSLDETKRFMAIQGVSSTLYKIANWNTSLELLFFYSPDSPVETAIRTSSASGDYAERETLLELACTYIDRQLAEKNHVPRGYLLTKTEKSGYVIEFYKIRNSYVGVVVHGREVLRPLEELSCQDGCIAFLCDAEGNIVSRTDGSDEPVDMAADAELVSHGGTDYLQLMFRSKKGDFYVGTLTEATAITGQLEKMHRMILLFIAFFLVVIVCMPTLVRRMVYVPIRRMEQGMRRIGEGEWDELVEDKTRVLEFKNMIGNFNCMAGEIKNLKIDNYEKELLNQKAKLQYLQMQVNPHFYLNALNIIYSLAEIRDFEKIQQMAMSLVEYSRYMFRDPESLVTVAEEIEHVDNYMRIQGIRFPNRITYRANISDEIADAVIPPFVIQSFVENSVKYAVRPQGKNLLCVDGRLREIEGELYVVIEVRDSGDGYSEEVLALNEARESPGSPDGKQVGLKSVQSRLRLVFGERAQMTLKNDGGAVAVLRIPFTWQEDE